MNDRVGIPVLALLGLSFTSCVDRAKDDAGEDGEQADPIVGEWIVTQIDAMALPRTSTEEEGYSTRYGWAMTVEPELAGDLTFYYAYNYHGFETGQFYRLNLTIDASKAPEYRLEVPYGLFPFDRGDEPYTDVSGYDSVSTITTYGTYGSTYDTFGSTYGDTEGDTVGGTLGSTGGYDTDTGTGTGTTGGVRGGPLAVPVLAGPDGPGGPPTLILTCNLVQDDALDCQRERVADDTADALHWRFKRADPDEPSGV